MPSINSDADAVLVAKRREVMISLETPGDESPGAFLKGSRKC
jgi:hypothetical protein